MHRCCAFPIVLVGLFLLYFIWLFSQTFPGNLEECEYVRCFGSAVFGRQLYYHVLAGLLPNYNFGQIVYTYVSV